MNTQLYAFLIALLVLTAGWSVVDALDLNGNTSVLEVAGENDGELEPDPELAGIPWIDSEDDSSDEDTVGNPWVEGGLAGNPWGENNVVGTDEDRTGDGSPWVDGLLAVSPWVQGKFAGTPWTDNKLAEGGHEVDPDPKVAIGHVDHGKST